MGIRSNIFKRRVQKINQNPPRHKQFIDYAHAKSFLILYESDLTENHNFVDELAHNLRSEGKHVTIIGFVNKKVSASASINDFTMLDKSQLDLWHRPKTTLL